MIPLNNVENMFGIWEQNMFAFQCFSFGQSQFYSNYVELFPFRLFKVRTI